MKSIMMRNIGNSIGDHIAANCSNLTFMYAGKRLDVVSVKDITVSLVDEFVGDGKYEFNGSCMVSYKVSENERDVLSQFFYIRGFADINSSGSAVPEIVMTGFISLY